MLALTGAALSGFVALQNKQKLFHPQQLQNCKMALRDKMQTSVDIFLAATSSHQESAMIKLQGQGRWLQLAQLLKPNQRIFIVKNFHDICTIFLPNLARRL